MASFCVCHLITLQPFEVEVFQLGSVVGSLGEGVSGLGGVVGLSGDWDGPAEILPRGNSAFSGSPSEPEVGGSLLEFM